MKSLQNEKEEQKDARDGSLEHVKLEQAAEKEGDTTRISKASLPLVDRYPLAKALKGGKVEFAGWAHIFVYGLKRVYVLSDGVILLPI